MGCLLQKRKSPPPWRKKKKGEAQKKPPDPDSFYQEFENLRIEDVRLNHT
jgi:hypothetical protein